MRPLYIAIDTGGTFTDCVWVERGQVRMLKVFSTPADPSQAIVEALEKIGLRTSTVLLHGTTVGTNTLLQRKGARVALVTTAGFGPTAEPHLFEQRLHFESYAAHIIPTHTRDRIEINPQFIGVLKIAGADWMRVQFDATQIDDPGEPGRIIDDDFLRGSARRE